MKVLTVRQPWASAIMSGAKTVENRTWMPQRIWEPGDRIAIHAGAAIDREAPAFLLDAEHLRDRGVVLGTVRVLSIHGAGMTGCKLHHCEKNPWAMWGDGMHHWMLAAPRLLVTPIPARGQLGLWTSPSVDDLLQSQPYQ